MQRFHYINISSPAQQANQENIKLPADPPIQADQPKNDENSFEVIKAKAEAGDAEAQFQLGKLYYQSGNTANKVESVKWFRKSAEQGFADAENKLGDLYEFGEGVWPDVIATANKTEAEKWYRLAAAHGNKAAQIMVAKFYIEQNPTVVDSTPNANNSTQTTSSIEQKPPVDDSTSTGNLPATFRPPQSAISVSASVSSSDANSKAYGIGKTPGSDSITPSQANDLQRAASSTGMSEAEMEKLRVQIENYIKSGQCDADVDKIYGHH